MNRFVLKTVKLNELHLNNGQIPGVGKNPRFIKDERFEALKKSIQDDPEMLELREIIAYDNNGELVIVGGNMRYRAMKELGFKDAPVKVLPKETAPEKIRAFIIKDNVAFGSNDWDILGNEFEVDELLDWGLECDFLKTTGEGDIDAFFEEADLSKEDTPKDIVISVHIPSDKEEIEEEVREAVKLAIEAFEGVKIK